MKKLQEQKLDLEDRLFWLPRDQEIKDALTTDVYFEYARDTLRFAKINPIVTMEVFTRKNPFGARWAVVCGVYEVAKLLQKIPVDVDALEEGGVFLTDPNSAVNEPILRITGHYQDIALYENPILGFLSQSSSICTKAARIVHLAQGRFVISFGTRRVHPALAPLVERCAYIGGVTNVSNVLGARLMKKEPSGTMPHSLILCVGEEQRAWEIFDEAMPESVSRIALVDTLSDEKTAAIKAFETLGRKLYGVRLDTPTSRRGDMAKIIQEVRWELDLRGGRNVKIMVSGGIDENEVFQLKEYVDGFGIGSSIAAPPMIDYCDKIVEVQDEKGERIPRAKRGDLSGRKNVFRKTTARSFNDVVTLNDKPPSSGYVSLLKPLLRNGKIIRKFYPLDELRKKTAEIVRKVSSLEVNLEWR